ncbi:YbaB/EbfC family nucleoid-associated protein [Corynebacterium sphenisci]|nr:YbaB/EbfC family nucleoid-associated protein [Corynebacterium sphenisci]
MTQPDMNAILAQAQQMQSQLEAAQQEIIASTVEGVAGGGLVKLTMTGAGEVTDIAIDPKVVDPEDVETLQDLVVGAFGDATGKVAELAEQKMGPLSQGFGGLGDALPGMGL